MSRFLEIIEYDTGKCEKRIEVTGKSEREVERLERGMLRNLNRDKFYVADTGYADGPKEVAT